MRRIVFYSWQSDLPNSTNRGFIQQALEGAARAIASDSTVAVEPVVDRDTQGVAGAPDIASTIFAKIAAADVFVADISIVVRSNEGRPSPNPNVLIELGYALKALGHERVILVFNEAYGKMTELPFDLKTRRLTNYSMPAESKERAAERKKLQSTLDTAIRAALDHSLAAEAPASIPAVVAIENVQANKTVMLRRNLDEILRRLDELQPKKHRDGGTVEDLIAGIHSTQELAAEFSKITEMIAVMDDRASALDVYRWFGKIFTRYDHPRGLSGRMSKADCDFFKFVGHELFVTLFAFLIREHRWPVVEQLLDEPIPVAYLAREQGPGNVYWDYASEHLCLLIDESHVTHRVSVHADILSQRHTLEGLAAILPLDEFIAADFFLFLYGELPHTEEPQRMRWRAWSTLYMKHAPLFLKSAERKQIAETLARVLKVPSVDALKVRLQSRVQGLGRLFRNGHWDSPVEAKEIQRIGSK